MTKEVRSILGKSLIVWKQKDKRQKEVAIPLEAKETKLSFSQSEFSGGYR